MLSGCVVTENAPTGTSVTVAPGTALVRGHFYQADAGTVLTIAANTSGHPRIDRIVLRANWTSKTVRPEVLMGAPAESPVAYSLFQIDGTIWDIPLAQVQVANGFTTLQDADITRERVWARPDYPGQLAPLTLATPPDGWLLCDGAAVSRTTYRDLFDAVGTAFGSGDGTTTFNLPDLRGRTLIGLDDMGTAAGAANRVRDAHADSRGGVGGAETHTLTVDELPSHTHQQAANTLRALSGGSRTTATGGTTNYVTTAADTVATGGDLGHNNMPPWLSLPIMIRT